MKQSDIIELIKFIDRVYKTDYAGDKSIVTDWFKVLKQYETKDIYDSLEYYMKNNTNFAPKVYDLTKGYSTIETKKLLENAKIKCQFCGEEIKYNDHKHEDRCLDIEFISRVVKKYKKQEIDKLKYKNMSIEEFKKYHMSAIKLVLDNSTNEREINMWNRYLKNL